MFEQLATWIVTQLLGLSVETRLGGAIHFFIYDTVKILFLLIVMIFIISYLRSYFPPEKVKLWLQGKRLFFGIVLAALLGVVSPFCSCSTVPLFIGFVEAGIPLSITLTFLISSPIVNEISLVLLFSMFGGQIATLYILFGVVLAMVAGWFLGKLKMEDQIEAYVYQIQMGESTIAQLSQRERLHDAWQNVADTVKKIWIYLLIGIGIGAWIHGYAPEELLVRYAGEENWLAVPFATIIGVPLYSNAVGSLPIIEALMNKGVAPGTALSFMMAITALSLPEVILLRKVIKPKLIAAFVGTVTVGIMIIGYLFNWII